MGIFLKYVKLDNIHRFLGEKKKGQAPTFVQKPKIIPMDGGKRIVLEVRLKADPAPTVVWYHGTDTVQLGGRLTSTLTQEDDVYIVQLEIRVCVLF